METKNSNDISQMEDEQLPCKNMRNPKLSVIVPVYNAEKTLNRCLTSIQKQTFSDWEAILIDDGSTDSSGLICEQYAQKDNRMIVIHQNNKGVSSARNKGIDESRGEFIMFVDSDDCVGSTYFETYILAIQETSCDVVIGGYTKVDRFGCREKIKLNNVGIHHEEIWNEIAVNSEPFGYMWNKLFRIDIIQKNYLKLRTDMYSQEDLNFCLNYFVFCNNFNIVSNTEYMYYFEQGKRIPPFENFIKNQLMLHEYASAKIKLSTRAEMELQKRILLLIYTCLYQAVEQNTFLNALEKLETIDDLEQYLCSVRVRDKKGMISRLFGKKHYKLIYMFFKIRNIFRDIYRKLRHSEN